PPPPPPAPAVPDLPPELRADLPAGLAQPPASPREFRAAWVATVNNIDWPSKPGLPNAAWRAEIVALLDRARAIGLNAIVLQVRTSGDALYASAIEPWSEYLTGAQGRAPAPLDDPLAIWVAEAHQRGLELHAWFNPYRARHSMARSPLAPQHIGVTRPHAVKRYGDQLWMDPAEPDAVAQTLAVVADVARRYDIDGVHIDDYFYPYPVKAVPADGPDGAELPFPDEPAWQRYRAGGGTLERADWRREQVDRFVEALHRTVRAIKPELRVGISPFGLGKPSLRPPGISGFSQYDKLFADVERWLAEGWLDYLAPQLYWPIDRAPQAFEVLLDYWLAQNPRRRHVWPGLFTSMVGAPAGSGTNTTPWAAAEVLQQVERVRARAGQGAGGHLHFSMAPLMQDRDGIATWLRAGPYSQAALVPATPWLGTARPPAPTLRRGANGELALEPGAAPGRPPALWSVWRRRAGEWRFEVVPATPAATVSPGADLLVVRAVNALGLEGPAAVWTP
ncbi:glycoside hydrolase family 10 protein, partial [Ideonella sp. A 288]|uniref:glycoside hydrolase family 10 protein n=1 Tax=Ideonella sp. A 288 TaxID=1962181 RepID=UPI0011855F1C